MKRAAWLIIQALMGAACFAPASSPIAGVPAPTDSSGKGAPATASAAVPHRDAGLPGPAAGVGDPTQASPVPTASAAAKAPARAAIKPLVRSKFLSQRDLDLFNSVCQLAETPQGVGCRCCPTEPGAKWCGEQTGEPLTTIEHVFYGAFSRPGAEEAYATGESYSCGNLSGWGANWFLRKERDRWSVVRGESYARHVLHAAVWDLPDGRRGMVTHDVISKLFTEMIAFTTFDAKGEPTRTELLGWSNSACIHRVPGFYQSVVLYGGANAFDHDKDGKRDLVITLKVKRRLADAAFQKQCNERFEGGKVPSPFDSAPATTHVIPLLFDGTRFTAEPRALARFGKATEEVDPQGNPFQP